MDYEQLIADGMINTMIDAKTGQKYYVWSEKVERPIIPFVDYERFFDGDECPKCGSTLRYVSMGRCVHCEREGARIRQAKKRAEAKASA
ncbi:hypothetical protein ACV5Z5_004647 [Salmonella enterica subsp. enterica]